MVNFNLFNPGFSHFVYAGHRFQSGSGPFGWALHSARGCAGWHSGVIVSPWGLWSSLSHERRERGAGLEHRAGGREFPVLFLEP